MNDLLQKLFYWPHLRYLAQVPQRRIIYINEA